MRAKTYHIENQTVIKSTKYASPTMPFCWLNHMPRSSTDKSEEQPNKKNPSQTSRLTGNVSNANF
ncbi:hypothetical protein HMPREF3226_02835 [Prevotella corporis]|uniref:Uncharacterized protein n=1 Tax=Prevotella corporis TaxID=28128 RepID=A0A133PSZ3_9BACT|nr:hypothetical protein HMPREF3226_02835 [Prevotella corporis]